MNKRNMTIAVITTVVIGSGVAFAGAKKCEGHFGGHGKSAEHKVEHMVEKMERRLDLSDAQVTEIRDIMNSNLDSFKDLGSTRKQIRSEVLSLDPQSPSFDAEVNQLADEIANTIREKAVQVAGVMKEVSGVLTDEQRAEARELIQKRMDHDHKWHDEDNG